MQTIYLDISNKGVVPTIYAKQGDVGRTFSIILTDAGVPYNVPSGSVFSAWYSGKSGSGNYTDIGADSAFSVNDNSVTVEMISQMLQIPGDGILCIVLSKSNGGQIGMWNIPYVCEKVPGYGSATAEDYFTAFSQAVENLPYPDSTLSAPGKAADAAAVGEALEGKAPAGYGLGEMQARTCTDCNAALLSGWYRLTPDTLNRPLYEASYSVMFVLSRQENQRTQIVYGNNGIQIVRTYSNSIWGEWEYVNPPMAPGFEYRTTGRWNNGKSVWTQLIDFGVLPNNTQKTKSCATFTQLCESCFTVTDGTYYSDANKEPWITGFNVSSGTILLKTNTDVSAYTATVQLWYVKD